MIIYRAATLDDVPQLSALVTRAFDARYGEGWSGGQLLGTLTLPGARADLAIVDGAVTGFTLTRAVADEVELLLIAVDAQRRGRGIGSALLDRAVAAARQVGAARLHLEVRDGNNSAQQLYKRRGFVCIGSRKDYYQGAGIERFDAMTMSLML